MTIQDGSHLSRRKFLIAIGVFLVSTLMLAGCSGIRPMGGVGNSLDCSLYKTNTSGGTLKFDLGAVQLPGGVELGLNRTEAIEWDGTMQKMIARYLDLCGRYNAGMLTKSEYDKKIQRINLLSHEARELEERIIDGVLKRHDSEIARAKGLSLRKLGTENDVGDVSKNDGAINEGIDRFSEKVSNNL